MEATHGLVVIVEDDRAIAELQRRYLADAGFGVHTVHDGRAGLASIRQLSPVAAIVDVGLPGMDGIELVRSLRADGVWLPVLFVTARDEEADRVLGLELGADDYLTKPFSPRELVARVKALVRRASGPPSASVMRAAGIELDLASRRVTRDGTPVELTATEFDLLEFLMRHPGQVLSRNQLLASVWGQAYYGGTRTVDVHVAQLRSKLGPPDAIRTVRGVGYALEERA
jgi:DNA-binding response OmpR family regulator